MERGNEALAFISVRVARRDRIVVSTLRCGRSNPGSNPGHGIAVRQCHGSRTRSFKEWQLPRRFKVLVIFKRNKVFWKHILQTNTAVQGISNCCKPPENTLSFQLKCSCFSPHF